MARKQQSMRTETVLRIRVSRDVMQRRSSRTRDPEDEGHCPETSVNYLPVDME